MRTLVRVALIAAGTAALGGCLELNYSTKDKLVNMARQYGDDVRWNRVESAALTVGAERRKLFIEQHRALEDDLEFADFELLDLEVAPDKKKATSRADYVWTRKREGLVQKTTTEQKWESVDGNWVMVKETRLRGAPLVLFDEPAKKKTSVPASTTPF